LKPSSHALDGIVELCGKHSRPEFSLEIARRSREMPRRELTSRFVMREMCVAIAFSQGARSALVGELIESDVFRAAFAEFDPAELRKRSATKIVRAHWRELSVIRFREKITRIVRCAQVLHSIETEHGSFDGFLKSFGIPQRIHSLADIGVFWSCFDSLQAVMKRRRMPFFRSTTSLLQLLLQLDYDCIKPDLIVMRLALRIGLVPRETGDRNLRRATRAVQEYTVHKGIRANAMDWYLLAFGGQSGAKRHLNQSFCPSRGACNNMHCAVGRDRQCGDFKK
jgi:3-methyladenine DNA glycosylase Tag